MKTLISWMAYNTDFHQGQVSEDSPNWSMHKYHYAYDRHILLYSSEEHDTRLEVLKNKLKVDFPDHLVETELLEIEDVIDLKEIKTKVERRLLSLREDEIDIFFSPGTSIMQLAWYICHTTLGLKTRLLQGRPRIFTADKKKSERLILDIVPSKVPVGAIIKQDLQDKEGKEDYLISESIKPVYKLAEKVAQASGITTLILGESGTGKEHLAGYVHQKSIRKEKPFIAVNCAAFNDELLESRLFGFQKGAFTGAMEDTKGYFEQAQGGTLFLDEIGDISPYMQQSLLRVLQEKEIQPIGGKARKVDVRIIAATNKDLPEMCRKGDFRWDLYYRLAIAELEIPSLLERGKEELEEYLNFFLKSKKKDFKQRKALNISKEAKRQLLQYTFPGNIRELENLVERFYVYCDEEIQLSDLPKRMIRENTDSSFRWQDVEAAHISKTLGFFGWNKKQACEALGYGSINTLVGKIEKYGLIETGQ